MGWIGMEEGTGGFPKRLSLEEQGKFMLGYYHQTQKKYEKSGPQSAIPTLRSASNLKSFQILIHLFLFITSYLH